jgi:ABC-2 type transport system ATP-binding protein
MKDTAIEVARLTKRYHAEQRGQSPVLAVDGVSFNVGAAEVFGFLGPNGAGKTTTVNILTTLVRASAGRGSILAHDLERDAIGVRRSSGSCPRCPTSTRSIPLGII